MLPERCKTCYYANRSCRSCDFYLITGIRNPHKPEECPNYKEGRRKGKVPPDFVKLGVYVKGTDNNHNGFFTSMEHLYNEGMNDKQIADELGCSPGSVARWRANHCLSSQKEIERMRKK